MILFVCPALSIIIVSLCSNVQGSNQSVSQFPRSIELKCGESSASIFCKLSDRRVSKNLRLVWYRYGVGSQRDREKLAEIHLQTQNKSFANNIEIWWDSQNHTAGLRITQLKTNHSGLYGCELVSILNIIRIETDQPTNLTITEGSCQPVGENRTASNVETGKGIEIEITLAAVISALLIIALLIYITVMYWSRKQDPIARPPIGDARCQAEEPISTVCSSDYAELKLPRRIDPENPTLSIISDDSYYATIVFSPQEHEARRQRIPADN